MRARLALHASGQAVEHREILLRDKPQAMLDASPKGTVPVLVLPDGRVLDESLDIMQWALGRHDPEDWLAEEASCLALIAACDGPFKHHLDRYKYASRYEGADATDHRARACDFLVQLDARLAGRANLQGDSMRLADAAIFPFVRQFAMTDRDWFDAQPFAGVRAWLDRHLASPHFAAIMTKHPLWQNEP